MSGLDYAMKIFTHYFGLAGFDGPDNHAEIEGAVEELYKAAVYQAKKEIYQELIGSLDDTLVDHIMDRKDFDLVYEAVRRLARP